MTETEPAENAPCLFSLFFKSTLFCCYYDYTQIKVDPLQFQTPQPLLQERNHDSNRALAKGSAPFPLRKESVAMVMLSQCGHETFAK